MNRKNDFHLKHFRRFVNQRFVKKYPIHLLPQKIDVIGITPLLFLNGLETLYKLLNYPIDIGRRYNVIKNL